jgi:hypothetical protein
MPGRSGTLCATFRRSPRSEARHPDDPARPRQPRQARGARRPGGGLRAAGAGVLRPAGAGPPRGGRRRAEQVRGPAVPAPGGEGDGPLGALAALRLAAGVRDRRVLDRQRRPRWGAPRGSSAAPRGSSWELPRIQPSLDRNATRAARRPPRWAVRWRAVGRRACRLEPTANRPRDGGTHRRRETEVAAADRAPRRPGSPTRPGERGRLGAGRRHLRNLHGHVGFTSRLGRYPWSCSGHRSPSRSRHSSP